MAPPLILRIIGDASGYYKTADGVVSANTKVGQSALAMGANFTKAAEAQIASGTKSIQVQRAMVAELTAGRAKLVAGTDEAIAADVALERAQANLNRTMGLSAASYAGAGRGAQTAERDLGKLTRGALAGSGVISSLGRSLAFASGGFIAVAGTATLLHNAITEALTFAATEKQVTAQLKTSGLSFETNKTQILDNLTAQSKLSAFTRGDLLQSFGYLVRVSGDVDQSLKLTAVAADVARGRHIALSSASIALAKALGGSSTALRRLGIIVPASAKGMDAIRYVAQKFAGQAEAGATSADHLRTSLVNAGETIGTDLLPTFNRLATEFGDWIAKMDASGKLQKDANEAITILGAAFHTLGGAIRIVDRATGGFKNTLAILIGLELGSKILAWGRALVILAGEWGLVGKAATEAGLAQSAALTEAGAAGAGGAAAGAAGGGILAGGVLGRLLGRGTTGVSTRVGMYTGGALAGEAGAAAGVSATGIGALAVAALLATDALAGLAKKANDAAGGGSLGDNIIGGVEGVLTGGLFGNSNFGILGQVLHKDSLFRQFLSPTPPPPPPAYLVNNTVPKFLQIPGLLGQAAAGTMGPFGTAQPLTQYWKAFTKTFKQTMDEAQAALTKGSADDIAAAKQEVARIKKGLDEGIFHGPALLGALAAEASDLQQIWSAEAAAAQKRAAAAAAAKQKIITDIQNAIDPIKLEVALSRAQSLGQTGVPQLKALLAAAYKGLARAIANGNQQLIKQAYDQITSLKASIQSALTTASKTFTEPMKLQIALARAQAFGGDTTDILKQMKAAALKALHSGKYTGQALIDLLNEIANINSQLNSNVATAYGDYKKASVKALTQGLDLTADARRRLEARLAQRGPGGTVPSDGTGAAGYVIDPNTGRPVRRGHHRRHPSYTAGGGGGGGGSPSIHADINLRVYIDGKQVEATVTKHQQRRRRHNPTQTRGPNAATATA